MNTQLAIWTPTTPAKIPANANDADQIVPYVNSHQLSIRDQRQIIVGFKNQAYEMVSTFVWNKSMASLKVQLGRLGSGFIAEMLDRPDIDGTSTIEQKLSDYDALYLAQELGTINATGALRLRQALERVVHFGQLDPSESEDMTQPEAVSLLRACVENILGQERIEAALDFREFRAALEEKHLDKSDEYIQKLDSSPYFFSRASVRILLALLKTSKGAHLENALANANVILPRLWPKLMAPERLQIGRAYAEVAAEGKATAVAALRSVLLKTGGFDYVPEDLRSRSFIAAANAIFAAHDGLNNFYNEPGPTKALQSMGSVIPLQAIPKCMSATLSIKLGNPWGISWDAQKYANAILRKISPERWSYYLKECLPADDRILFKLLDNGPLERWRELVKEFELVDLVRDASKIPTEIRFLILNVEKENNQKIQAAARKLLQKGGFVS